MRIIIDNDPANPSAWRWGIVDDLERLTHESVSHADLTLFEAVDQVHAVLVKMAQLQLARFSMPSKTQSAEKSVETPKKPLDLIPEPVYMEARHND